MSSSRGVWITAILAFFLTGALSFLESAVPVIHSINLKGRDFFFRLKHDLLPDPKQADQIALVVLDDSTLQNLSTRWPYPRSLYADVLKRIAPFAPRAIGFDFVFAGEDFSGESDQIFADAIQEMGNVVIATHWAAGGEVGPSSVFREKASAIGVVDKPRDQDRILRRAYMAFPVGDGIRRSWEYEIYTRAFPDLEPFPASRNRPFVINYFLRFDEFQQIPFWRLLEGEHGEIRDKILLLGLTSEAFHDIHATPLGSMPGLAVNANALLTLMTGKFFTVAPLWVAPLLGFFAFWLTLLAAISGTVIGSGLIIFAILAFFLFGSFFLFITQFVLDLWLVAIGTITIFVLAVVFREGQLFLENLRLREESARDPLTGFYSRRFLELKLRSELGRFASKEPGTHSIKDISVVMIDLDNFKLVNDSFGHAEGDRVLCTMAQAIRNAVRRNELICRYGGDEFCVILINTVAADAAKFADKLRAVVTEHPDLVYRTTGGTASIRVTASIGIASVMAAQTADPETLLKAADVALYRAKESGRNQVCVFDSAKDKLGD